MSKLLVTGGAGFIGSNLTEALLERGHSVKVLDNFATGKIENLLPLLEKYPDTLTLAGRRYPPISKNAAKPPRGLEYVFHVAALGSVLRSIKDPITSNEVNVSGFLQMLVASRVWMN